MTTVPRPNIRRLKATRSKVEAVKRELSAAAWDLGLTAARRRLCEAIVVESMNITNAAKAAGMTTVGAHTALKSDGVKKFMELLRAKAINETDATLENAIYSRLEGLARLTQQAEGLVPTRIKRDYVKAYRPKGVVKADAEPTTTPETVVHVEEEYDTLGATQAIVKSYDQPENAGQGNRTLVVNLGAIPAGVLGQAVKGFLSEDDGTTDQQG